MISVSELLSQRATLLVELKRVEDAIELMKDSAGAGPGLNRRL